MILLGEAEVFACGYFLTHLPNQFLLNRPRLCRAAAVARPALLPASGVAVAQLGGGLKTSYAFLDVHGAPAPIGVQFPKAVVDDAHKLVRVRACFSVIGLFPVVCLGKAVQQGKGFPIVLLDTEAAQVAVP